MAAGMVSPILVGRARELSILLDALERAAAGEPAVVLVGGEAGVGKTRLVEEAGACAAAAGARVLSGACVELGGDRLPLAPLVDALRMLARSTEDAELDALLGPARPDLARLLPELDPAAAQTEAATGSARTSQLLELVLGVVERLAAARPLVLVLEDLHWADQATLELVAFLVRALRGVRVLLVATYRTDELHRQHPLRPLVSGWDRVRSVERIELGRFARDEVAGQLGAILEAPPPGRLVDLVFERSEGNAFLVEEIVGAVRTGADPDYLPPSLRDMLLVRTERLSEPAQRVLRTVAVAGRWVPDGLLAAVTTLDEGTLYAALRETVDHHLLVVDGTGRGYAFRHALARDAVYEDILPGERVRLHTAYGLRLAAEPRLAGGDGSAPAALAYHWYAAHDLPRALTASIEAARRATAAYAPAEAQRHLERVLEIWPQVADAEERCNIDRGEAVRLAADAARAAGELDRALILLDEALEELRRDPEPDPARRALLLVRRSVVLRSLGRSEGAIPDLESALDGLPAEPVTPARAIVLAHLAGVFGGLARMREASRAAEEAVAAARATGAHQHEADAQITLGMARTYLGDGEAGLSALRAGLELALSGEDPDTTLRGYVNLSDALEVSARHEEAAAAAREGIALAARVGQARTLGAYLTANLGEPLMRLGRWDEAKRLVEDALAREPAGIFAASLLELRGQIAVHTGELAAAEDAVRRVRRLIGGRDEQYDHALAYIEAEAARCRGDLDAARGLAAAGLAIEPGRWSGRYAWPLVWSAIRTEAELARQARGRREPLPPTVVERTEWLLGVAGQLPADTTTGRAFRALVESEAARAAGTEADWTGAVAAWRDAGEPLGLAYSLLRLADSCCAAGERGDAQAAEGEAARLARGLGAEPLIAEVVDLARRGRLALDGVTAAPVDDGDAATSYGLTDREREVLELVAGGRTNSQIAAALFISRKTASVHVSNILAKLGVASRGEAAALVHRHGA